jgi:hypothetical protein
MDDPIHCPYRVEGNAFKIMEKNGDFFVCGNCGTISANKELFSVLHYSRAAGSLDFQKSDVVHSGRRVT